MGSAEKSGFAAEILDTALDADIRLKVIVTTVAVVIIIIIINDNSSKSPLIIMMMIMVIIIIKKIPQYKRTGAAWTV